MISKVVLVQDSWAFPWLHSRGQHGHFNWQLKRNYGEMVINKLQYVEKLLTELNNAFSQVYHLDVIPIRYIYRSKWNQSRDSFKMFPYEWISFSTLHSRSETQMRPQLAVDY